MMRLVIFGAIAFVVGLGGSTGALVFTAPARSPQADSLAAARAKAHADAAGTTATTHVVAAGSGQVPVPVPVAPRPDTAQAHAAPVQARAAASEGAPAPVVKSVPVAVRALGGEPVAPAPDAERFKQVGSILLNMKPAEAAKIVAYLNDEQVEGLLRSMTPRQAAVVLGQLPAERAAALSRRLLLAAPAEARP